MSGSEKTVLVVDDVAANRYAVSRTLRHANYKVIEASTGAEAVEQAREHHPDAIVLDMNLPDQTGMVTLEQLRADSDTAKIPVVFLTATAQSAFDRRQAEALGALAYLFLPVQSDTLLAVIAGIIEQGTRQQ